MHEIQVNVVEFGDRNHYQMQYKDPVTGRKKTKSTGVERTGRKTERTAAERVAAKFEAELREGRYKPASKVTWQEFRDRYEAEVLDALSSSTADSTSVAFGQIETILSPQKLSDLTTERLSVWVMKLRQGSRVDATVASYCRHLRSALNWAGQIGLIAEVPVIRGPKVNKTMKGRPITLEEHERGCNFRWGRS